MLVIDYSTFPNPTLKLFDGKNLKDSVVIENDMILSLVEDAIRNENPFSRIRTLREIKVACELFKPTKITIKEKDEKFNN